MKVKRKHIILLLAASLFFVVGGAFTMVVKESKKISATLLTDQKVFEAGNSILLNFKLNKPVQASLFVHSSFGSNVIESDKLRGSQFTIPEFIANKKGVLSYRLVYRSDILFQGKIHIRSNATTKVNLETYIGPPSILAGGWDYTMQVVIPTDSYDNPLPDSTDVLIQHQFLDIEKERVLHSKDMIGWAKIFSYTESGRMALSSKVKETVSKETSIEVFPWLPENFTISSHRKHEYADGNQVTEFTTSILKDKYDNVVSNGTLVEFVIKDSKGVLLHTQGSTINGRAIAKILHPDHKETWQISAYVHGMAESNTITLDYTPVIDDFEVVFNQDNRKIKVGPLVSFMGQLIPDGAIVKIDIFKGNKKIETKVKTSSKGIVRFLLQEGFYVSGNYSIKINALGVHKEYHNITLK